MTTNSDTVDNSDVGVAPTVCLVPARNSYWRFLVAGIDLSLFLSLAVWMLLNESPYLLVVWFATIGIVLAGVSVYALRARDVVSCSIFHDHLRVSGGVIRHKEVIVPYDTIAIARVVHERHQGAFYAIQIVRTDGTFVKVPGLTKADAQKGVDAIQSSLNATTRSA